ncbi:MULTISPECIES: thiopeptide-type bacteriocin biosynthesis protein [unclassified Streptomyces]|uniref:thiopeptide-type bacteriocin biosynthesis protein n=1 Tax=unclassified Streptomyces TaxID=2593676 RepID=UPI00093E738B|nr:thiopeptide-type bacteriocin biosynthesis protein [Streptomyces sp. TSRI0107]OKJ88322.1 hypothetical protein AMK31_07290 [Streptomyces sp. TSRI0107]
MTTTGTWHSYHLFLHSTTEDTDAFLTEEAAGLLDGLVASGQAAKWFFIRYGEGGPHLRIRVAGLSPSVAAELPSTLARAAKAVPSVGGPWPSHHGEVRVVEYVPETRRYGGPRALPTAEDVFVVSSRVAVAALRALRRQPAGGSGRLVLAADLAHATAYALGMDRVTAAKWLRGHAAGWRWVTEVPLLPAAAVHMRVNAVYAAQRSALNRRAASLWEGLAEGGAGVGVGEAWLVEWADRVRAADATLRARTESASADVDAALRWVWASQLHMLLNRLGVSPDEERAVCRLAARTLLDTDEPVSYFPQGHRAPDWQYLERSQIRIGRNEDSALRQAPSDAAARTDGPETPLPADPLPEVSLSAALAARSSARGEIGGPLDAGTLGALLWNSLAESSRTRRRFADGSDRIYTHRPYPSAGALHTARVRLLVLDVAGLPAATYDCVPESRTLRRVGPAPEKAEVEALSTYFSRPEEDPDRIGVDGAPVVAGLYVELGLLRRRYGLRALRLGLLETGHLAQTLLLTAAALGLAGTPLGGFHDDLAHELLGLDDMDQPLQYLLPLGRRTDG